jgi:hypothetical protein
LFLLNQGRSRGKKMIKIKVGRRECLMEFSHKGAAA